MLVSTGLLLAALPHSRLFRLPLNTTDKLQVFGTATVSAATYGGKRSVTLNEELDPNFGDVAAVEGLDFQDGTIDVDITAELTKNAPAGARGFVGIAFKGSADFSHYENFYLRMTNGRANNPELRSHTVQYCSVPDFTWDTLRRRRPGKYEAHADLEVGSWTHLRIKVTKGEAKFYVGEGKAPALVVHGLLGSNSHGKVGLWVAGYTRGHFANLVVRQD